jgi:hypothetical protein
MKWLASQIVDLFLMIFSPKAWRKRPHPKPPTGYDDPMIYRR